MNMVAIYRVCEYSYIVLAMCEHRVCEQGGSVRTGWQCANRVCEQGGNI